MMIDKSYLAVKDVPVFFFFSFNVKLQEGAADHWNHIIKIDHTQLPIVYFYKI